MGKKKTHDEYVKQVKNVNQNIEVIGKYIDAKTPIEHRCLIHDIYWDARPDNILQGKGCPKCAQERRDASKRWTQEQYVNKLKEIRPHIEVIGEYVNAKTKITHYCLKHHNYFDTTPDHLMGRGYGCDECGAEAYRNARAKTHEQYVSEVNEINTDIEVIEQYIDYKTPIKHYCKKHDFFWNTTPDCVLHCQGCPKCKSEKLSIMHTKTHEQYVNDLKVKNPDIIAIGTYIDVYTPILHKCLRDGCEWLVAPVYALSGSGCPCCHESKGERQVRLWLEKHYIEYIPQKPFEDCCDINPLPFDFYLPNENIVIEYDGQQHFEPIEFFGGIEGFNKQKKHDNIKNEYCKNNGIKLLRIPYYANIEEELNNFLFI